MIRRWKGTGNQRKSKKGKSERSENGKWQGNPLKVCSLKYEKSKREKERNGEKKCSVKVKD